jgi:hypothetical protein
MYWERISSLMPSRVFWKRPVNEIQKSRKFDRLTDTKFYTSVGTSSTATPSAIIHALGRAANLTWPPNDDIHYSDKQSVQRGKGGSGAAAPGGRLQGAAKLILKLKKKSSALNNFYIIESNNKKFNKSYFLKYIISVSRHQCDYSPWAPKSLARPLIPKY